METLEMGVASGSSMMEREEKEGSWETRQGQGLAKSDHAQ